MVPTSLVLISDRFTYLGLYLRYQSLTAQTSRPEVVAGTPNLQPRLAGHKPSRTLVHLRHIPGQWAFMSLLAEEQFTFGGSILGRGYDVAEIIGDRGAAGSLELRYDYSLPKIKLQTIQFYAFYDAGEMWNYELVGGTPLKQSGTSTGFGARFAFNKYISGNVMWTQVLTKQIAAEELIGRGKRPRVFFSILASV